MSTPTIVRYLSRMTGLPRFVLIWDEGDNGWSTPSANDGCHTRAEEAQSIDTRVVGGAVLSGTTYWDARSLALK